MTGVQTCALPISLEFYHQPGTANANKRSFPYSADYAVASDIVDELEIGRASCRERV